MMTGTGVDLHCFRASFSFLSKWEGRATYPWSSGGLWHSALMLTIQAVSHSSSEVTLLRARSDGMSGSLSTLILVLGEKKGRKFSLGSHDLTWHRSIKGLGDFLGCLPISLAFHFLAVSVCAGVLSEAPRDIAAQRKGAKGFQEAVEDWLCSNSAGISVLIVWHVPKLEFIGTPFPSPRIKR